MKLKLFISQLKKGIEKNKMNVMKILSTLQNTLKNIKLLQEVFDSRFSDFSEEERMLAFIYPFSLNVSNMKMKLIEPKANSVLKIKFDELSSLPSSSEMIDFWRSLSCEHFPEMRKFAWSYSCLFGTTYKCEQSLSFMKIIKKKLRSRRSESNLKNSLLLSVTNLTPNITGLVKAKRRQKSH